MAFRASNVLPSAAYTIVRQAAVQLVLNLNGMNAQLASSGADYDFLHGIYMTLSRANSQFSELKATPGIADHAKTAEGDPSYDVVAAFTAMQSAIEDALLWMDTNIPTSVTVKAPSTWDESTMIANTFTSAQTGGLRAALQSVINEVS